MENTTQHPMPSSHSVIQQIDFTRDESDPFKDYLHLPAFLHIYVDGIDAAEGTISTYLFMTLDSIVDGLPGLLQGNNINIQWMGSALYLEIISHPESNQVILTLHLPTSDSAVIKELTVPLNNFAEEVIKVGERWLVYLDKHLHQETSSKRDGKYFRIAKENLEKAAQALGEYQS